MRWDNLIFGSVRIRFDECDRKKVLNRLLCENLSAEIRSGPYIEVPLIRMKKYTRCLSGIKTEIGEVRGLFGSILKISKRYGLILGVLMCAVYFIASSSLVWDVRIEGCSSALAAEVSVELDAAGLKVGAPWRSLSSDEVENRVLLSSDNVGWININRRGSVAYVSVGEKNVHNVTNPEAVYSNIVAAEDAVIEKISVKRGIAMVKAGDTVKAGQLLVSGVIPAELGGGFCNAEADISGRIYRDVKVFVPRTESVTERRAERICGVTLKIFNFSINIYKNYRNIDNECAIIESEDYAVIFGSVRLPLGIKKSYVERSAITEISRTDKQLISVASVRLAALRILRLGSAELIKASSSSELSKGGIEMRSEMIVVADIGEERVFFAEDKS